MNRIRITIHGAVQGVGFRPFVFNLAEELKLTGWVCNTSCGVVIEGEGDKGALDQFLVRLKNEKPPRSFFQSLQCSHLEPIGFKKFEIKESSASDQKQAIILPDIATCPECLFEILNEKDRRHLYPFTNCTNCGPRYSIIESLPYDRPSTSMKDFNMCEDCQKEYDNSKNRRFHAQPNACPECGPHLELWDETGGVVDSHHQALLTAARALKAGKIVAIKGLGGFHLMVDANNPKALESLRYRKHRQEKPFALMFPTIESIESECEVSQQEKALIVSVECPIVLVKREETCNLPKELAPGNPYLGVMLPYTPLHHILMRELNIPMVATSANLSDEPICTDNLEALKRLKNIADLFLVHNRPIVRHMDDSIVRVMAGRPMVLRRARGFAPLPVFVKDDSRDVLALGAHLKNSVCLKVKSNCFVSQHIGDLDTKESLDAFKKTTQSLKGLYEANPTLIAHDLHPEYMSTKFANELNCKLVAVQHHHAHVAACMAENQLDGEVLGISFDGTGYGLDQTIWGGEFLVATLKDFKRVGHFRTFRLPGGEKAIKEPRRAAFGMLWEIFGDEIMDLKDLPTLKAFTSKELASLKHMLEKDLNSPVTSSAGRLFDGVASLIDVCQQMNFEGQAAMALEFLTTCHSRESSPLRSRKDFATAEQGGNPGDGSPILHKAKLCIRTNPVQNFILRRVKAFGDDNGYSFDINEDNGLLILDWEGLVKEIIFDVQNNIDRGTIALKFHKALVESAVDVAKKVGIKKVVLTGGCFQNKVVSEHLIARLIDEGFNPHWHQLIPPNDGGISLGQVIVGSKSDKG